MSAMAPPGQAATGDAHTRAANERSFIMQPASEKPSRYSSPAFTNARDGKRLQRGSIGTTWRVNPDRTTRAAGCDFTGVIASLQQDRPLPQNLGMQPSCAAARECPGVTADVAGRLRSRARCAARVCRTT